jgi:hypothetical protein
VGRTHLEQSASADVSSSFFGDYFPLFKAQVLVARSMMRVLNAIRSPLPIWLLLRYSFHGTRHRCGDCVSKLVRSLKYFVACVLVTLSSFGHLLVSHRSASSRKQETRPFLELGALSSKVARARVKALDAKSSSSLHHCFLDHTSEHLRRGIQRAIPQMTNGESVASLRAFLGLRNRG